MAGGGGLFGGIRDDGPAGGRGGFEGEAGFEVGLVEAGEGEARVHGDEEGVEVFVVVEGVDDAGDRAVGLGDGGFEVEIDGVLAGGEG